MKTIKDIHTGFASAVANVNKHLAAGTVSQSRASANASQFKATTVTVADTSKVSENDLAKLKADIRLYNAGYAFQNAFGANLAALNESHTLKASDDAPQNVTTLPPAPQEAAPEAKGKTKKVA